MSKRQTIKSVAETLIRESKSSFSSDDFIKKVQERWHKEIAPSTLEDLKNKLFDHQSLIEINEDDFLPFQVVLNKIGPVPIWVPLSHLEIEHRVFVPGHRLIPFTSPEIEDKKMTFFNEKGEALTGRSESFLIEDIALLFQYLDEKRFPDQIELNPWVPEKSSLKTKVWDLSSIWPDRACQSGDGLWVRLLSYDEGRYEVTWANPSDERDLRLKARAFYLALEKAMDSLSTQEEYLSSDLEKQLLLAFFALEPDQREIPLFSMPQFIESLSRFQIRNDAFGVRLTLDNNTDPNPKWETEEHLAKGHTQTLDLIFQDMQLAFTEQEFKSILITAMENTKGFHIEFLFNLLFAGKQECFYDDKQYNSFFKLLRDLLEEIKEDMLIPEPLLLSQLRREAVETKLRLIEILRYLEIQKVSIGDLPQAILDPLAEVDSFCSKALVSLSDMKSPPIIASVRNIRMALKMIVPIIDQLEKDIFENLGIY